MNMTNRCYLVLSLLLAVANPLPAAPARQAHRNEITQVDLTASTVTIFNDHGEAKIYRVGAGTEILVNNQRGTINDLSPGMPAQVTSREPGVAERITVDNRVAPEDSKVRVPANAGPDNPVVVGTVKAGQQVTIVPIKVWWSGGGSKTGVYCDWNGYKGSGSKGMPWMVLVAAVGKSTFVPANNILTVTVPEDGTLVIYANDRKPQDNLGAGDITVTVADK